MKIGLVTDSTADIPDELVHRYGIRVVPALVNIGDQSFEDGTGISREEFYTRLPRLDPPPTTSAPSVGSFQERYENLFKSGVSEIVSIHAANTLSGIFNGARLAAESFQRRIHVIDSGQLTLGIGFQALAAAEAIASGALVEEVLARISSIRQRAHVAALLDTLEYMRRSGRVSWTRAVVGGILNIKPLVELRDGVVHRLGQARTRGQGIQRLTEALQAWGPVERLAVLHTNAEAAARQLLEELKPKLAVPPLVVNVTTAIGAHVGPNGLGFAAVTSG
ncbi:MAG: DegV family protein [Chloroflexi bacterium]|nr:DegV family protein [Chloroflexota bacterium]